MHFEPGEFTDPRECHLETTPVHKSSRRIRGLPPEFGLLVKPPRVMTTTTACQTNEGSGAFSPLVVHLPHTPRPFHGDIFEDVEDWLDHFDRVAAFNEWDDTRKLRSVYCSLRESAQTWYENHAPTFTSWLEFRRQLLEDFRNSERKEKAEIALQSRAQKPNESVSMFVEDMTRLFRRADPGMSEAKKVRHLMRGVKEQLFAGLVRSPPTTVADFVREATSMERALQQRNMQYGRQASVAACASAVNDEHALRELVRSVVREELRLLQQGDCRPTFAAFTDVVRDEVRRAMGPAAPADVASPVRTYTDVYPMLAPTVEHRTYTDVVRTPTSAPPQVLPTVTQPFGRTLNPATRYEPRRLERKATVWRTSDNRPLCYHCGEEGHVFRHCPYRRLGLRGFSPNAPRPRYGERPREIEEYLSAHELTSTSPATHQSRTPTPRRYSSPIRPGSPRSGGNRSPSPHRGN